jgi:hypothetical protein
MELLIPKGSLGGTIFFMLHSHRITHAVQRMQPPDVQAKKTGKNTRIMGLIPFTHPKLSQCHSGPTHLARARFIEFFTVN